MSLYLSNEEPKRLLMWAAPRVDLKGSWPRDAQPLGVLDADTGAIRAVMVTVQTYDEIIDAHFASDGSRRWATRNILGGLFGYLFILRGAKRVQTIVAPDNRETMIMNYKLGFTFEACIAAVMDDGGPGVLMSMTPETCKWIKEPDNG